jgi:hypothetical protein
MIDGRESATKVARAPGAKNIPICLRPPFDLVTYIPAHKLSFHTHHQRKYTRSRTMCVVRSASSIIAIDVPPMHLTDRNTLSPISPQASFSLCRSSPGENCARELNDVHEVLNKSFPSTAGCWRLVYSPKFIHATERISNERKNRKRTGYDSMVGSF